MSPMHIAFIDIAYEYRADRPAHDAPLGGTTTALCFLAKELAAAGHTATIFNRTQVPELAWGVPTLPLTELTLLRSNTPDVVVFVGRWTPTMVQAVREYTTAPRVAWMHQHQFDDQFVQPLPDFSHIVFVSDWQARQCAPHVPAGTEWLVIRNAISLFCQDMFARGCDIVAQKDPHLCLYVGDTPRGLLHMPAVWERLKKHHPLLKLEIYSRPVVSDNADENNHFATQLRAMPGVAHVGAVGQQRLAACMKHAAFLLSPNPYPETSCLVLADALAAGMLAITTNRAALPETAAGFATHVPIAAHDDPCAFRQPLSIDDFASAALAQMEAWEKGLWPHNATTNDTLTQQTVHFNTHHRWHLRQREWVALCA